ncbi:MAG TPA: GNAT family N-acetyltransferase [Usitatibacter sp.]|nr:GNAT family N-acetyltransferase [Usitatibacter sp.]
MSTTPAPASREVRLRPCVAQDAEFLRRVYRSTREDELRVLPWSDADKAAFLDMQFEAQRKHYEGAYPRCAFQVVEVDGAGAGRLYVDRTEKDINVLDIALLPRFRGHGIGTTLLGAILEEARASRRTVTLHVEQYNPARRLYERLGFRSLETNGVYERMRWAAPAPVIT